MQQNLFVGRVAAAPTISGTGDSAVCKFTLMDNAYAGKDDGGQAKEKTIALQFTAFRSRAEAIAKNVMKGDQLIVSYSIENNNYTKAGEDVYGYNFIVHEFSFGAPGAEKRKALAAKGQDAEKLYD